MKLIEHQKQIRLISYYSKFETSNFTVKNDANSPKTFVNQTNVVYKFTRLFRECLSENNITANNYIGHTATTLSHRFTYYLSSISTIKQYLMTKHDKDTDSNPPIKKSKLTIKKIIYRNNNKKRLHILEAITIKKTTINKIAFNIGINILKIFNY